MRNKLLPPIVSTRCTGRTTAVALDVLSRAVNKQGAVCYAVDHMGASTQYATCLRERIMQIVHALNLQYVRCEVVMGAGQYAGHVRVISEIWED